MLGYWLRLNFLKNLWKIYRTVSSMLILRCCYEEQFFRVSTFSKIYVKNYFEVLGHDSSRIIHYPETNFILFSSKLNFQTIQLLGSERQSLSTKNWLQKEINVCFADCF